MEFTDIDKKNIKKMYKKYGQKLVSKIIKKQDKLKMSESIRSTMRKMRKQDGWGGALSNVLATSSIPDCDICEMANAKYNAEKTDEEKRYFYELNENQKDELFKVLGDDNKEKLKKVCDIKTSHKILKRIDDYGDIERVKFFKIYYSLKQHYYSCQALKEIKKAGTDITLDLYNKFDNLNKKFKTLKDTRQPDLFIELTEFFKKEKEIPYIKDFYNENTSNFVDFFKEYLKKKIQTKPKDIGPITKEDIEQINIIIFKKIFSVPIFRIAKIIQNKNRDYIASKLPKLWGNLPVMIQQQPVELQFNPNYQHMQQQPVIMQQQPVVMQQQPVPVQQPVVQQMQQQPVAVQKPVVQQMQQQPVAVQPVTQQ